MLSGPYTNCAFNVRAISGTQLYSMAKRTTLLGRGGGRGISFPGVWRERDGVEREQLEFTKLTLTFDRVLVGQG